VTSTAVAPAQTITVPVAFDATVHSSATPCEDLPSPYTISGKSYDVHCGTVYQGTFINSDGLGLSSMEECLIACNMVEGCIAVDWAEEQLQCGLLSSLEDGMVVSFDSAVLIVES